MDQLHFLGTPLPGASNQLKGCGHCCLANHPYMSLGYCVCSTTRRGASSMSKTRALGALLSHTQGLPPTTRLDPLAACHPPPHNSCLSTFFSKTMHLVFGGPKKGSLLVANRWSTIPLGANHTCSVHVCGAPFWWPSSFVPGCPLGMVLLCTRFPSWCDHFGSLINGAPRVVGGSSAVLTPFSLFLVQVTLAVCVICLRN